MSSSSIVRVGAPVAVMLMLTFLAGQGFVAFAHGEAIKANATQAKSGDEVTVSGEEFPVGEEVELLLEGTRGEVDLGHAVADENGTFEFVATIPASTAAGIYQLVGVTADDRVTTDFTVLAGSTGADTGGSETVLTFERSVTETVVIGILAAIALLMGGALVYSSRHKDHGATA